MDRDALNMAKTNIRIGFRNVCTMYASGKLAEITAEMKRYNLQVLGVSEADELIQGEYEQQQVKHNCNLVKKDGYHDEGVAVILKKGVEKSLMEWKQISNTLLTVGLREKEVNMTLFQCYAPTNDADEEAKNAFYEQIQQEPRQNTRP